MSPILGPQPDAPPGIERHPPVTRISPRRRARFLAVPTIAALAFLTACTTETKDKAEAAEDLAVVAEDMVTALTEAELGPLTYSDFIDNPCHDEELDLYQLVMQFTIDIDGETPRYLINEINREWVNEHDHFDMESGLQEGRSGALTTHTSHEGYRFRATLQPDRESITVSIASSCYENPDDNPWVDPIEVHPPVDLEDE